MVIMVSSLDVALFEKHRKKIRLVNITQSMLHGLEYTLIQGSILQYLETGVGVKKDLKLWYGLANGIAFLLPLIYVALFRSRVSLVENNKARFFLCNLVNLIGTCVYVLPYSTWCTVGGRFLQGFALVTRWVMFSEMPSWYTQQEIASSINYFIFSLSIGEFLGTCVNIALIPVKFSLGNFIFTYGNSQMIIMFGLSLIQILLTITCIPSTNQVKEKEEEEHTDGRSYLVRLKAIFSWDMFFLLIISFYSGFFNVFFTRVIPWLMQYMKYDVVVVNICYMSIALSAVVMSAFFNNVLTIMGTHRCGLIAFVASLFASLGPGLAAIKDLNGYYNSVLFGCAFFSYALFLMAIQIFLIRSLGRLFGTNNEMLSENIRMTVNLLGRFTGGVVVAYLFHYYVYFVIGNLIIAFVSMAICMKRRNGLKEAQ